MTRTLSLGRWTTFDEPGVPRRVDTRRLDLPPHHFVTHAAVLGMTGSGKTGLVFVLVEEALRNEIPVLLFDLKGDLANLLLAFPPSTPEPSAPGSTRTRRTTRAARPRTSAPTSPPSATPA